MSVGIVKTSFHRAFSQIEPETKWANHGQFETRLIYEWRDEPVFVAKNSDDLWLGVKS